MTEHQPIEWREPRRDDCLRWIYVFANSNGRILAIDRADKAKGVRASECYKFAERFARNASRNARVRGSGESRHGRFDQRNPQSGVSMMMSEIGKPERATQERAIALFRNSPGRIRDRHSTVRQPGPCLSTRIYHFPRFW